jgi:hypothetical protein
MFAASYKQVRTERKSFLRDNLYFSSITCIIQEELGTIIRRFCIVPWPLTFRFNTLRHHSEIHFSFLPLNTSGHMLESKTLDMALSSPPWTGAGLLENEEFAEALQHLLSRSDR